MRFKKIDRDKVPLKIEPYPCLDEEGFMVSALEGVSNKPFGTGKGWGRTREEALACFFRCLEPETEFMEPDVNLNERCFDKTIFMGNGQYTYGQCQLLHKKLDKAFEILGGLQQNGGQGTAFDYETDKKDCEDIKAILEEINTALSCAPQEKPDVS